MPDKPIESFFKKARVDAGLRSRLANIAEATSKEDAFTRVVSLAQAEGFTFTADEFQTEFNRRIGELSPAQLESVVGGLPIILGTKSPAVPETNVVIAIIAILVG